MSLHITEKGIAYGLHARFGKDTIPLSEICEEYFGINPKTAQQKARSYDLPLPVFRMDESQRAPYLVMVNDLAEFIFKQQEIARGEWLTAQGRNH